MYYLVAVFRDRIEAEAAYTKLEEGNIPTDAMAILGQGYQSADEFGLIDPNEQAWRQAKLMATWLIPFGFVGGITFNAITGLDTFPWAGELGNRLLGGLLGAISGAMGSVFVGGGAGLVLGSGDALPYRNRLRAGKYLLVVRGSERITNQATLMMRPFNPENLQGYEAPSDAF